MMTNISRAALSVVVIAPLLVPVSNGAMAQQATSVTGQIDPSAAREHPRPKRITRTNFYLPRPAQINDADVLVWLIGATEIESQVVTEWLKEMEVTTRDAVRQFDSELAVTGEAISSLPRPIVDAHDLANVKRAWSARDRWVRGLFDAQRESLLRVAAAHGMEQSVTQDFANRAMAVQESLVAVGSTPTVPGARLDALHLVFAFVRDYSPPLTDEEQALVRQIAVDEAPRLIELRRSMVTLSLRACAKEHEVRARWLLLPPDKRHEGSSVKALVAPVASAERRLSLAQSEFVTSVCAVLPVSASRALSDLFQLRAYGVLAGDPFGLTHIGEQLRALPNIKAVDLEAINGLLETDRANAEIAHGQFLARVDLACQKLAASAMRDAREMDLTEAAFEQWIEGRRRAAEATILALQSIVATAGIDATVLEEFVDDWRAEAAARTERQRFSQILSGITGFQRSGGPVSER